MTEPRPFDRVERLLAWMLAGSSIAFALLYGVVALIRLRYPFELNYIESAMSMSVDRIQDGLSPYGAPSERHVALIYTPLFFYASALAAVLTGPGLTALRLVSVVASFAAMAGIGAITWTVSRSALASVVAGGFLAATYALTGGWLDVGRVDSLFLALMIAAMWLSRASRSTVGAVLAGCLWTAAVLTKQTAVLVAIPAVAAGAWQSRRDGLIRATAFGASLVGSAAILEVSSGGWFSFYVARVAAEQQLRFQNGGELLGFGFALPLSIALVVSAFFARSIRNRIAADLQLAAAIAALLASTVASALAEGAARNTLMPGAAAIAILLGLAVDAARRGSSTERRFTFAACLAQFLLVTYDPRPLVPSAADEAAGRALVRQLQERPGDVLVYEHTTLARLAGKRAFVHGAPAADLLRSKQSTPIEQFRAALLDVIASGGFSLVIIDRPEWFSDALAECYHEARPVFEDSTTFLPVAGYRTRPALMFARRDTCHDQ